MSQDSFILPHTADPPFYLPELKFDHCDYSPDIALTIWEGFGFSADRLTTGLSQKCSQGGIEEYLQQFPREEVSRSLEHHAEGPRIMAYAVDTENVEIVQLLLGYNGDASSKYFDDVPLLAFAIMRVRRNEHTSLEMIKLLLSYGANPLVIPREMWKDYVNTPIAMNYNSDKMSSSERWCVHKYRFALAKELDLTTRYYLWKASRLRKPARRMLQIAEASKMTALLRLPFRIIGQELAVKLVIDTVYTHMAQDTEKPLVMVFAGATGHEKTELAIQMGSLLSVQNITIGYTHFNSQTAQFGSIFGDESNANRTPLNSFLVDNHGKRCVVFLDEFDKADDNTLNALLKVMDDGTYRDRRWGADDAELDCRRVIWILSTNLGNDAISGFHSQYLAKCSNEDVANISIEPLQSELEELYMSHFPPAITNRIDAIAPFFPFNKGEQAVIAHKFLLEFIDEIRRPINERANRLVGHTKIRMVEDGKVCGEVARKWYKEGLGAPSIYKGVRALRRKFVLKYADTDDLVGDSMDEGDHERYVIQLNPTGEDRELSISRE
ncbi:P-loop containing nucleoside triphosphate hydrolase protein [Daldinia vernicosa]|uniref:P-loop containing nucleoside triphosphate hydrolase protein n=1 Tax=Daldinia vernicosa TaxID=114800 RepID=UPI0020089A99|nr:P-loop containing nucleoside triphosphate hydrolase protein [Daldinia vernicosa]KAI0848050.1 P-loop containing nucleoside triphosphate hydrolase protein [Daldinia vernicosa]